MDQKGKARDDTGSSSGDSTITMLSDTPSPPPEFRVAPLSGREHSHDARNPSGDSAVVMSGTSPSPNPPISRIPTFEEFMGIEPGPSSKASSEASTIILPGNSPKSSEMLSGEASKSTVLAEPQSQVSPHYVKCTMRDRKSGKCICMCGAPCFIQENVALAAEIASLFPGATIQELRSLNVTDVVYRFLGNAHSLAQVGNPNLAVGASDGNDNNVNHQTADPFYRAQRGIQMLLDADKFLSALEVRNQTNTQPRPGKMPRMKEETPQESDDMVNRVESGTDNDTVMNVEESDDETIIASESDVEMSSGSTETYTPSSSSSSDS